MNFSSIIGHDRAIGILKRALANDALAHAYLFAGESGIGKRTTALALAAALNCSAPLPEGGCGSCAACHRVAAGSHPDVLVIMPESEDEQLLSTLSKREAGKASDRIKIEQVRQAQERLSLKAFEGRKKVLIIDGAETMTDEASNAFLKTLEEPPGDSLIIMITSLPQGLLATIRSRCQAIAFPPLPRKVLAGVLQEKRGLGAEDAWFLAALSRGSIGRAMDMNIEEERKTREEFLSVLDGLGGMPPHEVLAMAEGIAKDRDGFERLIEIAIEWLRDLLVFHLSGDERLLVYPGGRDRVRARQQVLVPASVLRDLDLLAASRQMLGRRVSTQLIAENLFLRLGRA
jgi:DNA polymerase-3 subunit delta'